MIGIICALPQEAAALTSYHLQRGKPTLIDDKYLVCLSGMGRKNASHAAKALLDHNAEALLSWGFAGGLSSELPCGAIILPRVLLTANAIEYLVDATWHQKTQMQLSKYFVLNIGTLTENNGVVVNPTEKAAKYKQSGAIAVDMESVAIAEIANNARKPCLVVRVVFDDFRTTVPSSILSSMNDRGELNIAKMAQSIMKNPIQFFNIIQLALASFRAKKKLKKIAEIISLN